MAATTAGALKAYLEAQGLGVTVFRDRAREDQAFPYLTVTEGIAVTPEETFNAFDDEDGHVVELAQVDVWQTWRNDDRTIAESYTLADAVALALNGAILTTLPNYVGAARVASVVRLLEVEENVVHHAVTVEVRRTLARRS